MHKSPTTLYSILSLCAVLLFGCEKKAVDEIDYGTVTNSVYENQYFGLKLSLPPEWDIQDQEMRQRLTEVGSQAVSGNNEELKAALKASEQKSINLLAAFQDPIGTKNSFNPSIISVAEQIRAMPDVKRGKDYHFHARKLMEAGQVPFEFPKEITTENLGGVEFDILHASITPPGTITVNQKYYAAIIKGYALLFIGSYTTAEEEAVLQSIFDGITFQ